MSKVWTARSSSAPAASPAHPQPPLCKCGDESRHGTSQKQNQNIGRQFFSCKKWKSDGGCGFFAWVDEYASGQGRGRGNFGDMTKQAHNAGLTRSHNSSGKIAIDTQIIGYGDVDPELGVQQPAFMVRIPVDCKERRIIDTISNIQGVSPLHVDSSEGVRIFKFSDTSAVEKSLQSLHDICDVARPPTSIFKCVTEELQRKRPTLDWSNCKIPKALYDIMMPFQRSGVEYAVSRGGRVLIGDEMGLGKTVQAIALMSNYVREWPALVICPSGIKLMWQKSILKFLRYLPPSAVQVVEKGRDPLEGKVVIVSYDIAHKPAFIEKLNTLNPQVVILDEAHAIKSHDSQRTQKLRPILKNCSRLVLLTGTPALNRPIEIFNLVDAIVRSSHHIFCQKQLFGNRYCDLKKNHFGRYDWKGHSNLAELQYLLRLTNMIRREKDAVLDELPDKIRTEIHLTITDGEKNLLDADLKKMKDRFRSLDDIDNAGLGGGGSSSMMLFTATSKAKQKPVCEYIEQSCATGEKYLIFAHHIEMLDAVERCVTDICESHNNSKDFNPEDGLWSHIRLDGSSSGGAKDSLVNEFQTNPGCKYAVLSIMACGTGLTLTASNTVIFAELFWTPGQLVQAEDRVHRIGQKNSCNIKYLLAKDTSDDVLWPMVNRKLAVLGAALNKKNEGAEHRSNWTENITEFQRGHQLQLKDGSRETISKTSFTAKVEAKKGKGKKSTSNKVQSTLDSFIKPKTRPPPEAPKQPLPPTEKGIVDYSKPTTANAHILVQQPDQYGQRGHNSLTNNSIISNGAPFSNTNPTAGNNPSIINRGNPISGFSNNNQSIHSNPISGNNPSIPGGGIPVSRSNPIPTSSNPIVGNNSVSNNQSILSNGNAINSSIIRNPISGSNHSILSNVNPITNSGSNHSVLSNSNQINASVTSNPTGGGTHSILNKNNPVNHPISCSNPINHPTGNPIVAEPSSRNLHPGVPNTVGGDLTDRPVIINNPIQQTSGTLNQTTMNINTNSIGTGLSMVSNPINVNKTSMMSISNSINPSNPISGNLINRSNNSVLSSSNPVTHPTSGGNNPTSGSNHSILSNSNPIAHSFPVGANPTGGNNHSISNPITGSNHSILSRSNPINSSTNLTNGKNQTILSNSNPINGQMHQQVKMASTISTNSGVGVGVGVGVANSFNQPMTNHLRPPVISNPIPNQLQQHQQQGIPSHHRQGVSSTTVDYSKQANPSKSTVVDYSRPANRQQIQSQNAPPEFERPHTAPAASPPRKRKFNLFVDGDFSCNSIGGNAVPQQQQQHLVQNTSPSIAGNQQPQPQHPPSHLQQQQQQHLVQNASSSIAPTAGNQQPQPQPQHPPSHPQPQPQQGTNARCPPAESPNFPNYSNPHHHQRGLQPASNLVTTSRNQSEPQPINPAITNIVRSNTTVAEQPPPLTRNENVAATKTAANTNRVVVDSAAAAPTPTTVPAAAGVETPARDTDYGGHNPYILLGEVTAEPRKTPPTKKANGVALLQSALLKRRRSGKASP